MDYVSRPSVKGYCHYFVPSLATPIDSEAAISGVFTPLKKMKEAHTLRET